MILDVLREAMMLTDFGQSTGDLDCNVYLAEVGQGVPEADRGE